MTASQDAVGTARGRRIVQLADPIDDQDAATKAYVDAGGGSQPADYVQIDDPGAVGAGKTWLQLPPLIAPDPWAAETPYLQGQRVVPNTPNDHYYYAIGAGTSDDTEPALWPTDGGQVLDNDINWQDAGEITPVLVGSLQLWYRNDADDGWMRIGAADSIGYSTQTLTAFDASGIPRGQVTMHQDFGGYFGMWSYDEGGNALGEVWAEPTFSGLSAYAAGGSGDFASEHESGLTIWNLPTDDPLVPGAAWNDNGTVKISAGPPP